MNHADLFITCVLFRMDSDGDSDKSPGGVKPPEELPTTGDPTSEDSLLAGSMDSKVNELSHGKGDGMKGEGRLASECHGVRKGDW